MDSAALRAFLVMTGLSPGEFARLVDVTPRAVTMWLSGERAVPGPAAAYARVFAGMPPTARYSELVRIKESEIKMRDGMYAVVYQGTQGAGYATVLFDNGRVYGADPFGAKYDGYYDYDVSSGLAELHVKLTFPPHVAPVFADAQPFEWSVDIVGHMDPRHERGLADFKTTLGHKIQTQYQFLRELPPSLA